MHIPDGFLSTPVWLGLDAAAVPAFGCAARRAQRGLDETRVPLLGVMGAFVFAAQMITFPVGIGTSGHLVGAALLAIILGPAAAVVVMTAILVVQAFVFQDGGVLALGANILNMAIAGVLAGYLPYYFWGAAHRRAAVFAGGALSVLAAAALALSELLVSGVRMPSAVVWASLGLFVVSAVAEGAITVAVVAGIERLSPGAIRRPGLAPGWAPAALATVSVLLASFGVLFASANPDGIWRVVGALGIAGRARKLFEAPLADYQTRIFGSPWIEKASAGLAGLALIYALSVMLARLFARERSA